MKKQDMKDRKDESRGMKRYESGKKGGLRPNGIEKWKPMKDGQKGQPGKMEWK